MNNQEITALVRGDITTIQCVFMQGAQTEYTFFTTKALADTLEIDSLVLVDTQNGVSIVQVRSMENKLGTGELQAHINYHYAFDKVNLNKLTAIQNANKKVEKLVGQHRREKARVQAMVELGITDQSDIDELFSDIKGELQHGND